MKRGLLLATALLAASLAPTASAQSMHNEQALIDGAAYSANYPNTFYLSTVTSDGLTARGSGVRLNERYGLISGHQIFENGSTPPAFSDLLIGTGSNRISDPGTLFGIEEYIVHPDWGGTIGGNSVDLAIVRFDSPWFGDDLSIGTANVGDLLTYSGYGTPATPSLGFIEPDGQRRAYQSWVDEFGAGAFGDNYIVGDFNPIGWPIGFGDLELGGVGTPGNSGGGVYNELGDLVGITSAQFNAPNYFGNTKSLYLDPYSDWIAANTIFPGPDFNNDGQVNLADLNILLANFGQPGDQSSGDADGNGTVDLADLNIVLAEFGT